LEFWQQTATKIVAVLQLAASLFGIGAAAAFSLSKNPHRVALRVEAQTQDK
jgi:hypothetical protein